MIKNKKEDRNYPPKNGFDGAWRRSGQNTAAAGRYATTEAVCDDYVDSGHLGFFDEGEREIDNDGDQNALLQANGSSSL